LAFSRDEIIATDW